MDLGLHRRTALITGGSKGIGAAIVRRLAQEGVRVAVCARASDALDRLQAEIRATGADFLAVPADVLAPDSGRTCVDTVVEAWGGLDILVNNVGGALRFGGFEDLADEDWERAFDFNVMSVVRFSRAALPHLRLSPLKRIINLSSISGIQPGYFNPHYALTKAAVMNLSKHLANVLAKEKILVNCVCPGPVRSESWQENIRRLSVEWNLPYDEAEARVERQEAAKIPLGEIGEGEQIAAAVALLASPLSSWTTGSCVHIHGGKLAAAL